MAKDVAKASAPYGNTLGSSGTAIYGGYITTNEENAGLTYQDKYKTFSENLVNCAIIGAGVRYFLNLTSKAGWKATPADDENPEAIDLAEWVEEVIQDADTPWPRIVRRASMYRFYGFSIQEITAKLRTKDGRIGIKDIEPRPQRTIEKWDTEPNGDVLGVVQRIPQDGTEVYLPRKKIVYVVDDSISDSPEGLGLFRNTVSYAQRLKAYEALEAVGYETDLRGIPLARAPIAVMQQMVKDGKITQTVMDAATQALKDFITNHYRGAKTGLLLDSLTYQTQDEKGNPSSVYQYGMELMRGGSSFMPEILKSIERINHEIARLLGVEHLLLGTQSKGSFALARDKTNNFFLIVDSTLQEIAWSFNKDLIDLLWELNGFDEELKPTLVPEPSKFTDLELISQVLSDLASAGAPLAPDDPAINEIREMLGLPKLDLDDIRDLMEESLIPPEPDPDEEEDVMPEEGEDDGASSRDE
jgi:hypothetical protein